MPLNSETANANTNATAGVVRPQVEDGPAATEEELDGKREEYEGLTVKLSTVIEDRNGMLSRRAKLAAQVADLDQKIKKTEADIATLRAQLKDALDNQ